MAKAAPKAGRGPCPQCGEPVTFRTSAGGMLKYKCDACDSAGYAEQGGTAYAKWQASITKPEPAPAPIAAPAPEKTAEPAQKRRGAFDLSQLGA